MRASQKQHFHISVLRSIKLTIHLLFLPASRRTEQLTFWEQNPNVAFGKPPLPHTQPLQFRWSLLQLQLQGWTHDPDLSSENEAFS